MFWGAIAILGVMGAAQTRIAEDLLRLELGYTLLASLVVGAIIGGLTGNWFCRRRRRNQEKRLRKRLSPL